MQGKIRWAMKVQIDDGQLEQLVARGRQLHDHAVCDFFAWLVTSPMRVARQCFVKDSLRKDGINYGERLSLNHKPQILS